MVNQQIPDKLIASRDAGGPALATDVKADLIRLGGVNAGETDLGRANLNGVAVNDSGQAGNLPCHGRLS
jgi:hypothetical protein